MTKNISEEYLNLQKDLHLKLDYGTASLSIAPEVKQIFEKNNCKSISDYGAGKCNLKKKLIELGLKDFDYFPYDPVFPEYGFPKKADLVCCIDVLEHIEEVFIKNVIEELRDITKSLAYFTIALTPAKKILKNGVNAHILLKSEDWWLNLIKTKFKIVEINNNSKRLKLLLC